MSDREAGPRALDRFLARRYLASRKGGRFLSLITWIALGGVTLGVTALVVVLSVMNGAQEDLRDMILGATPHVHVLESSGSLRMNEWEQVRERVARVDGVVSAQPFLLTQAGIVRPGYAQPADFYGISLDQDEGVSELERRLASPEYLGGPRGDLPGLVLGQRLAERLDVLVGDTVQVVSMENIRQDPLGGFLPKIVNFVILGRIDTGLYDYDLRSVYARLDDVQDLLDIREANQVSGIYVRTEDPWQAETVRDEIRDELGGYPYYAQSWLQLNASLLSALKLEKLAMGLILLLIVVVAAFNIVSTLVMVVADRTREIGILKSMGMTDARIQRVFVYQGLWIGLIGSVVGTTLGLILCVILDRFPLITLPAEVYSLDTLPVSVQWLDVAGVLVLSIVIAYLATLYPARQAASLDPVEAIRHE